VWRCDACGGRSGLVIRFAFEAGVLFSPTKPNQPSPARPSPNPTQAPTHTHASKGREHLRHLVRDAEAHAARGRPPPHEPDLPPVGDVEAGEAGAAGLRRPVDLLVLDGGEVARQP